VSNTYCVVFLLCFSSSCVPYVASFSGLSLLDYSFDILYRLYTYIHDQLGTRTLITSSLLQKPGGKDEPNIVYMWKSKRKSQHRTQNVDTHNRTTQKTKKMSNTDSTNKPWVNSCAREGYAVMTNISSTAFYFHIRI
jgi:hypothetical protein